MRRSWTLALVAALLLIASGCGGGSPPSPDEASARTAPTIPPPTSIASGDPPAEVTEATDTLFAAPLADPPARALETVGSSGDVRLAWYLVDLLRFHAMPTAAASLAAQLESLTGVPQPSADSVWSFYTDLLLTWDVPAPPGYASRKRALFLAHDPGSDAFFDTDAAIDWRTVSASGAPRDGVAQLDDPEVVPAAEGGGWLPDGDEVIGLAVGDERRAYPMRVLETHEIVNDTLGGRRVVLMYCSHCGAVLVWYADRPEGEDSEPVATLQFHSSGLMNDGAPLPYDVASQSLFDPFTGRAITGPLEDASVGLEPVVTIRAAWGDWRGAHPDTTVVSDDGGVGRIYLDDPLADEGVPSWPIGSRDGRLDGGAPVFGVWDGAGRLVAFPVDQVQASLASGDPVEWEDVRVQRDAGGLVATDRQGGDELAGVESYWFAWSRFHPETAVWVADR